VVTRTGIDGLREQLHAEALRRGLGQAAGALVISDGAVWIWRLADDRFPQARQRLGFYHALQHLAAVGRALFGEDQAKLKAWLKPLVQQLKNQSATKVIHQLEEALGQLPGGRRLKRCKGKSIISMSMRTGWITALDADAASPLAAARWKPPAGRTSAASNDPDSSGVRQAMKPCCVWKPSGATIIGTFSFPTPHSTLHETEMRTAWPPQTQILA
jgi:hypothetical protein